MDFCKISSVDNARGDITKVVCTSEYNQNSKTTLIPFNNRIERIDCCFMVTKHKPVKHHKIGNPCTT